MAINNAAHSPKYLDILHQYLMSEHLFERESGSTNAGGHHISYSVDASSAQYLKTRELDCLHNYAVTIVETSPGAVGTISVTATCYFRQWLQLYVETHHHVLGFKISKNLCRTVWLSFKLDARSTIDIVRSVPT